RRLRVNDPFAQLKLIGRNPVGRNTFGVVRCSGDVKSRPLDMAQKSENADWFQQVISKARFFCNSLFLLAERVGFEPTWGY
ncbi:hypothetical protein, partial [Acidithiobacillus sp.]|uniref:hypothetical protein n=1 Tax=Acidithiobacillus sp. TaxID=1872118 RepID=UPI002619AC6C